MSRIGKQSIVYGAGVLISKSVSFLMLPLYTRYLSPSDYGVLQLIDATLEVASIFAGSRLAMGIFHFYHKADDDQGRREVLGSALLVMVSLFAAVALVTFVAAEPLAHLLFGTGALAGLIRIGTANFALQSLLTVTYAHLRLMERPVTIVKVNGARSAIQLVLNILLLVVFRLGPAGILVSTLVANLLIGAWLVVRFVREVRPLVAGPRATALLRFGLPLLGVHLAKFITTFGDRYFLQGAGGTALVGLYALAYQFGFLLVTIGDAPFNLVWEPLRFAVAKRADRDVVYARVFLIFNLLLLSTAVAMSLFVSEFLRIMTVPAFHRAADWVPIILAAYVFQSWAKFN